MAKRIPPYDIIYEGPLEMHFHSAIIKHFSSLYGLKFLRCLKPSPQREVWLGFDQGWVYSTTPTPKSFQDIQTAVETNSPTVSKLYIGYFMQFKVVRKMQGKSDYKPNGFPSSYFRAEVDLKPNKTTGLSQHETLMRLCNVAKASVCYACGMLFDLADLYVPPDLRKLRAVPASSAPTGWSAGERHFIAFRNSTDPKLQ
ncbi:MAG TPA: hypothetical protein VLR90_01905 [Blastocatellia bacterium]|nr:hypothetical protein [Blastocatellia bacterium]